ncbi:MAG: hypothetical protein R3270_06020 [Gammaproteobacteria bacterium]|nr:hypothetical protein [Gammaproteobacteria bacterium]
MGLINERLQRNAFKAAFRHVVTTWQEYAPPLRCREIPSGRHECTAP